MNDPEGLAEKLKSKIKVVKDAAIRRAVLAQELANLDAEQMARVLATIMGRAADGYPLYKDMMRSLGDMSELTSRAGKEKMNDVYDFCVREEIEDLASMLREIGPRKHVKDHSEDVFIDQRLSELSLGMRKTMGRTGGRDMVDRLLHDQDPNVIEQILTNPGITENHVIRIASKRPTNAEILRRVSRSTRWNRSYRVRKSLVFNPYTPAEISINLLQLLLTQDIQEVTKDQNLHIELRLAARRLLAGREPE